MIPDEPPLLRGRKGPLSNSNPRWKWYYASICDYRMAHPGCKNEEVAAYINRNPNLVTAITNSDIYREYEAQRRQAWREETEAELRQKLTGVTIKALDILDIQIDKKKDQIPIGMVKEIVETGLDRLGFAPSPVGPSVSIVNQTLSLPNSVSALALEEARMALRAVEAQRLKTPMIELDTASEASSRSAGCVVDEKEAEPRPPAATAVEPDEGS